MRVSVAGCIIHKEVLKNSPVKKHIEYYNSCSEAEKERINQVDRFHTLASLTNKKFIEGIITDISSEVKDYKITYTFFISGYKQKFKYSIYEDDEKEKLKSKDNILVIVDREENYYLVNRLEHKL